jgi:hypothetical protein
MSQQPQDVRLSPASWFAVLIAWILVGVPLLWGIFITFKKAVVLFR